MSSILDVNKFVTIHPERVGDVSTPHIPYNNSTSTSSTNSHFTSPLTSTTTRLSSNRIEFDLIGIDASIANAIRRVLIAEVPTVAIEDVYLHNNTSVVQDEVLAHRLGLVPFKINPAVIHVRSPGEDTHDQNTVVFTLQATCTHAPGAKPDEKDPHKRYIGSDVLSELITWDSKGKQDELFDVPPQPVNKNILLAKLRPGQEIDAELHCVLGVGRDHAKFSPVSTASYRILPEIQMNSNNNRLPKIESREEMKKFQACFPRGVIGIRKLGDGEDEVESEDLDLIDEDELEVFLKENGGRLDTVSREVLRYKEFEGKVLLGRKRDHFLFDIESTGIYTPESLLPTSIDVLLSKLKRVKEGVEKLAMEHAVDLDV